MLKNLASLSSTKLTAFLQSFDSVLCDYNGVVWMITKPIPGVKETLDILRDYGKRVHLVSNNSILGTERFSRIIKNFDLGFEMNDVIYPTLSIIQYLQEINYDKKIYVFGNSVVKKELQDAGFKIADEPDRIEENIIGIRSVVNDDEEIGAVLFDVDFNLNYPKLLQSATYLRRPEVLFITGATDEQFPIGDGHQLLGPKYFQDSIAHFTGRVPLGFGKPDLNYNKYIRQQFNIRDPSRTLFIGDSLTQDMGFASACGYQKLLVLTGRNSLEEAEKCGDKDMIPPFYLNSLGDLHEIIKEKLGDKKSSVI